MKNSPKSKIIIIIITEMEILKKRLKLFLRINYIKAKIDNVQQNSKCRLWRERDEMINHRVSKCSKLAQKEYKSRHDRVGKVIHWELCKRLKFDYTTNWYKHKPETILKNGIHEILWDFEIQKDYLIPARNLTLLLIGI